MIDKKTDVEISTISNAYKKYQLNKDDQSLFYINQMIDLLFNEIKFETSDENQLERIVLKDYKKDINHIFDNMKDYYLKIIDNSIKNMNQILTVSTSNKYVDINSVNNIYNKFKEEMENNLSITKKIEVIVSTSSAPYLENIQNICLIENRHKISEIFLRYKSFIQNELIKNVKDKSDFLLKSYKKLIDSILSDLQTDKDKINDANSKIINNVAITYLKEQEYFIINKYMNDSFNYINNTFSVFENYIFENLSIKKQDKKINSLKDYLLGFNNTITVKIKDIFDQMNEVIYMDSNNVSNKIKEFNDKISLIYETSFIFDKEFNKYKKEFNVSNKNIDIFNESFNKWKDEVTKKVKTNVSNIFRENIKIYNDIIYKNMLLKSKLDTFNTVLSVEKVKDLLLK